jgi:hypothetical protein
MPHRPPARSKRVFPSRAVLRKRDAHNTRIDDETERH